MNKNKSMVLVLGVVLASAVVAGVLLVGGGGAGSGPKTGQQSYSTASDLSSVSTKPQNHVVNVTDSVSVGDRH